MEFVKGKPKGTNPAIMGYRIDMYAVNGSKKQSILLLEKPHLGNGVGNGRTELDAKVTCSRLPLSMQVFHRLVWHIESGVQEGVLNFIHSFIHL